ncbi:MAG: MraY family glycosyltransferase, partial [Campylobacterota bacterium]|nr:MraY family glycosyltransferase [Campylobacterota bacterium]
MGKIALISLGTFVISLILQYLILRLSHRYNLFMDSPSSSKPQGFHSDETPRSGGIGIAIALLFFLPTPLGWKLFLSLLFAFLSGIFEDFHHSIKATTRLFLQFIAASSAVFLIHSVVTYFGFGITVPYFIGAIISIVAIIGMMNAINFIDGFNGLASGIVLLMLFAFGIVAYRVGNSDIVYISAIIFSALFAFFLFNFPKGKIFLGDGGAYLLGASVAIIGIFLGGAYDLVSPWYVLTVLIYPVWEVLFSIYRKLSSGHSPLKPDAYHLHMLIYRNITHNNPLTSLYIIAGVSPFILIPTFFYARVSSANFLTTVLFIVLYLLLYYYLLKKET